MNDVSNSKIKHSFIKLDTHSAFGIHVVIVTNIFNMKSTLKHQNKMMREKRSSEIFHKLPLVQPISFQNFQMGVATVSQGFVGQRPGICHTAVKFPSLSSFDRKKPCVQRQRTALRTMAAADVWALDFDGVTCDSCGESSQSAWKVKMKLHLT